MSCTRRNILAVRLQHLIKKMYFKQKGLKSCIKEYIYDEYAEYWWFTFFAVAKFWSISLIFVLITSFLLHNSRYSTLSIYHGHFSSFNARKTPYSAPLWCLSWVQIWLMFYQCNCCVVCTIAPYTTAIYREFILHVCYAPSILACTTQSFTKIDALRVEFPIYLHCVRRRPLPCCLYASMFSATKVLSQHKDDLSKYGIFILTVLSR